MKYYMRTKLSGNDTLKCLLISKTSQLFVLNGKE